MEELHGRGVLKLSWGPTVNGRESLGVDVFGKIISYLGRLAAEGHVDSHQMYIAMDGDLGSHGGFIMVPGTFAQLRALQADVEWNRLLVAASCVALNLVIGLYGGGDARATMEIVSLHLSVHDQLGLLADSA